MRHSTFTKKWIALLVLLLAVPGVFAQKTRFVDPIGKTTGSCSSPKPSDRNGPCAPSHAYSKLNSKHGDIFLVQVLTEGGTVTLDAPGEALTKRIVFGAYAKESETAVEGTLKFSGTFTIASAGQIRLRDETKAEFEKVVVQSGDRGKHHLFLESGESGGRITITDRLTFSGGKNSAVLDRMVVSKSFLLESDSDSEGSTLIINKGLTVNSGATLTLSQTFLVLALRKGKNDTDPEGLLTVNGDIQAKQATTGHIWVAHRTDSRGNVKERFIKSTEYKPKENGVDHNDCFRIRGSGAINADIHLNASGNVCVDVGKVGSIRIAGSIKEKITSQKRQNITTDLIFRNDVAVDGSLEQWGDSRVVFEKTATITGNVILDDGVLPTNDFPEIYGIARIARKGRDDSGVREGVQMGDTGTYTCTYSATRTDKKQRGAHIPGVQFEGKASIGGNLEVRSRNITNLNSTSEDTPESTQCAPRVLFMVHPPKTTGGAWVNTVSEIGENLIIRDDQNFRKTGRVHLSAQQSGNYPAFRNTTHSLSLGGNIIASGTTIGTVTSAISASNAECAKLSSGRARDLGVFRGSTLSLSAGVEHVISISDTLTLGSLETAGNLDIQDGILTVSDLYVRPGGKLKADDDVVVSSALVLEGDGLAGTLSSGSTISKLTYASRDTDIVKPGAMADKLSTLSILVGDGELRLDEVTKTDKLGLCSGTLVLREAGTTEDSTLHVSNQITVLNGFIRKDTNKPGSIATDKASEASEADRYLLKYVTEGTHEVKGALEWFDPRDVEVNHKDADIVMTGDHSLAGKLTVTSGKLTVDGDLTVGVSSLHRAGNTAANTAALTNVGKYSVVLGDTSGVSNTSGNLYTKGDNVVVHGQVILHEESELITDGGDVHVLGRVNKGNYPDSTAQVTVAEKAMVDLGAGALMLGPADTAKRNGLTNASRPDVVLTLHGTLDGMISVPKGSKVTKIDAATDSKMLGIVTFDGMQTPKTSGDDNWDGTLKFMIATGKTLMIDSLSAMHGTVETHNKAVTITKDVHLSSARLSLYGESTEFKGNLTLSGTGGLSSKDTLSVLIRGNFMQTKGEMADSSGVDLHTNTTKTVMGDFLVAKDAAPYKTNKMSTLVLHGDFQYMKEKLTAKVEFKGKEAQEVETGMETELDSVVVDNPRGLRLASSVIQGETAALTLRRGRIMNADTTASYAWTVKNPQIEEDLRGRTSASEAKKCGSDEDEACKFSISKGSLQSYASTLFARHLKQGNLGDGALSGGYLFPVGMSDGEESYYRPLILQLPFDLTDMDSTTVSLVPKEDVPVDLPALDLTAPDSLGESMTLDVYSDIFWKIKTEGEFENEVNVRVTAAGLQNVSNVKGLRIVQWNCETEKWANQKLAGHYNYEENTESFSVNDSLSGVVNLTQERIVLDTCTILGIAANGAENPIGQDNLGGERAQIQFIHNVSSLTTPVDVHLGDLQISSGLSFREATPYRPVGVGSYELKIQADGVSEDQAITSTLDLKKNKNYVVIAHGATEDTQIKVLETRLNSLVMTQTDVVLVHGAPDLGTVDVRVLDTSDNTVPPVILADNIPFDAKTVYVPLDPSIHNVQVTSPNDLEMLTVFQMDLNEYGGETLVLNLSGSKSDLAILGVDKNGLAFLPDVVTNVEVAHTELPTEFALHGNYPNPFNPSTRIQFDLPEMAQVRVQIVDMLGREVMALPEQEFEAGANRSIELNATNLASGTYLYRMIATGTEGRHVKTGRMTLIK